VCTDKSSSKKIFLIGPPRVGKTSLIVEFLKNFPGEKVGFITLEVREGGMRSGFLLKTLSGKEEIFASKKFSFPWKVGKYGVNIPLFEKLALPELEKAYKNPHVLVVIDEIGKMELLSPRFEKAIYKLLSQPNPLIATVGKISHPLVEKIMREERIFEVSRKNRKEMLGLLKNIFPVTQKR
jgi:nucleoside-triphosphatase THEP1